jgi:hypothetical protein
MVLQLGSFRRAVENRTKVSGEGIKGCAATGSTRLLLPRSWPNCVALGSDAQRRIVVKLDQFRASSRRGGSRRSSCDVRYVRVRARFRVRQ